MTAGENAGGECAVYLKRKWNTWWGKLEKQGKKKALRRIKFVAYHSDLGKNLKERIHLNLDEGTLHKIKLFILC